MNPKHDLERRIADYYATEAPSRAPAWLLARALDTIDTTPQRRTGLGRPWRIPPVTSFAKLAVGAVAIVTIAAVGLTVLRLPSVGPAASASASPEPSLSPSAPLSPPLTERFDSAIHGISIDYPSGWQTRPATEPWTGGELTFDSPAADVIFDPTLGDRLYLVLASQPYGDLSEDQWRDENVDWLCTGEGMAFGSWTVDGADAFVVTCPSTASAAVIFTDTRGYLIRLVASTDEPGLAETYDWDWHKVVLETVDLRPEEALDAVTASPSATPSPVTPTPSPRLEAEQIIAEGNLNAFAATRSGTVLTVWGTCGFLDTDCGYAWRLGTGSQPPATGMVGGAGSAGGAYAIGDGFVLTPGRNRDQGFLITQDGTASPQSFSRDCRDAFWSTPTEPGRLVWAPGLDFVDTVAGTICPTSRLGGPSLAKGVFTPEGLLWALVDNETDPDTLTIGRYDGAQWRYHDLAPQGGSWTSLLAAAGSTVVVLQAAPEPPPQRLVGLSVSTDAGATWTQVADLDVLDRDLPFAKYRSPDSMAFAGSSVLYVADAWGDLWRSTDFTTFDQVSVPGLVQDLQSAGDAVIARIVDGTACDRPAVCQINDLVRISADGSVELLTVR